MKRTRPFDRAGGEALVVALEDSLWDPKVRQGGRANFKHTVVLTFSGNSFQCFPFVLSRSVHHHFSIILCPSEILGSRQDEKQKCGNSMKGTVVPAFLASWEGNKYYSIFHMKEQTYASSCSDLLDEASKTRAKSNVFVRARMMLA